VEVLRDIPFSLDAEALLEQARVERGSEDEAAFRALVDLARETGRPKAAYAVAFVEAREGESVTLGGATFTSRALRKNLEAAERVFPLVATCGAEMDAAFTGKGDLLQVFWWDLIKTRLLHAANRRLDEHLHRRFRLGKTSVMRPGSGDAAVWPIEQQRPLFALLGDVEGAIGVRLTESCLMMPNKTTSGVLFPTAKDFRACEVCHRDPCPSRQVPFNPRLWRELQHD
jgi:hypothetical protein